MNSIREVRKTSHREVTLHKIIIESHSNADTHTPSVSATNSSSTFLFKGRQAEKGSTERELSKCSWELGSQGLMDSRQLSGL